MNRLLFWYLLFFANNEMYTDNCIWITDNPTPKFGEALRAQVEERLNFSKREHRRLNANRRVLEDLALEENESDGHTAQPYDQDLQ